MIPIDATDSGTMYLVSWHWRSEPTRPYTDRVRIIDSYSTLADIPKILAVKATGRAADAADVSIVSIAAENLPERGTVEGSGDFTVS